MTAQQLTGRDVAAADTADVAVVVVTYRSRDHIDGLLESLRAENSPELRIRVVVVDNDSGDGTLEAVRRSRDVVAVAAGGNLGYASGINLAVRAAGDADAYLVLNPDLQVEPGCVAALWRRMQASNAGIVVPAILDAEGRLSQSVRREPTLRRALGDAVFGRHWTTRPGWASEVVREPDAYTRAHPIEWATGAALLIRRDVAERVGDWDERFFLYSEETDYFRRARDAGFSVWFEPDARVQHWEAGSGRPPELVALTIVNGLRYTEKHRPWSVAPHRAILLLHETRRWRDPTHQVARSALLNRSRWQQLPAATVRAANVDHVLVTRFNLPSPGPESLIRAQDGWLADRMRLFETYTVPSVQAQTNQNFHWMIYFDPESPKWLRDRVAPWIDAGLFTPLYRETADWADVAADSRELTGATGDLLITTNLDNDDALAADFVERLHQAARPGRTEALFLTAGLIRLDGRVYLHRDPHNAFCSVAEPWDDPQTAWRDWHIMLGRHMEVRTLSGPPAWLQVIHGRNVSNRVRGRLADPADYARLFPDLLDGVAGPTRLELAADRWLQRPARNLLDYSRKTVKHALLATVGKGGLDQIKQRLTPTART